MPTGPKVAQVSRQERIIKVLGHLEAEESRSPDYHVAIAREVEIKVNRKKIQKEQEFDDGLPVRCCVDDFRGKRFEAKEAWGRQQHNLNHANKYTQVSLKDTIAVRKDRSEPHPVLAKILVSLDRTGQQAKKVLSW